MADGKRFWREFEKDVASQQQSKGAFIGQRPQKRDCGGSLAFGFGYGGRRVRHKNRQYKLFLINKFELGN